MSGLFFWSSRWLSCRSKSLLYMNVALNPCITRLMMDRFCFFWGRDWGGSSAIPVVPAVTHVRGFLVQRQVELLFLCPQVLLCLITVRVCRDVGQFSPDVCVTLVNISFCWSYCCSLLSCLLLLEVTKHVCCRIAKILTPAWKSLHRFHFPVEKCFF